MELLRPRFCEPAFHEVTARVPVRLFARAPAERWGEAMSSEHASFREVCVAMRELAFGGVLGGFTRPLARLAYRLVYRHWGQYLADSDWLAAQSGGLLTPAECAFLQRQYSWAHASPYMPGCSTLACWDPAHAEMLCFRSLDWPAAATIGRTTRVFELLGPDGAVHGYSAGMMGMLGMLTAVRDGVAVVLNFAPSSGLAGRFRTDPTLMLRRFVEDLSVRGFHDAVECLRVERPGAPCFVTVCGVARGEACVLAWDVAGPPEIRWADPVSGILVQTNHFDAASRSARRNRTQLRTPPPTGWFHSRLQRNSEQRAQALRHGLATLAQTGEAVTPAALCALYAAPPLWNHETAHWVELRPARNQLRAWIHRPDLVA